MLQFSIVRNGDEFNSGVEAAPLPLIYVPEIMYDILGDNVTG
jgi:hypothetical protein